MYLILGAILQQEYTPLNNRDRWLDSNAKLERGKAVLLKILRGVLSILVIVLAGYSLSSGDFEIMPYMMFVMGAMFLAMGIDEIKETRKLMGTFSILTSIFVFYVSLQGFN